MIRSKLGNVRTDCRLGHSHASKLESAVCQMLQLREKAGEIDIVQTQSNVYLTDAKILYIPDFECEDKKTEQIFFVEAKGMETPVYRIKRRLWKFYGPGPLIVYKGSHDRIFEHETIIPVAAKTKDKTG